MPAKRAGKDVGYEAGLELGWPAGLFGAGSFDGANFFSTTTGITGQAGGNFWVARWFTILGQVGSATRLLGRTLTASAGWNLRTTGTNASLTFLCVSSAPASVVSPAYTVAAADVGKIMLAVGVHDGSFVRLYVNRAEVGSGTAITSYTVPAATERLGDICDQMVLFGGAGGHGVPTLAQVQAYFDLVKSSRRMVAMPNVTTNRVWNTDRAGTITDEVSGSATLTVTGTLAARRHSLVWGW